MSSEISSAFKIGAWAMIGGTVATGVMFYKAKQEAKKRDSWGPYILATFISPVTMFYGGITGAILKGAPLTAGAEYMVKAPYHFTKATFQYGPEVVKLPFHFAYWLFTK